MVLVDTGFWLALSDRDDAHHARAVASLNGLDEPMITTWPVIVETCHMLRTRVGIKALTVFLKNYADQTFQTFAILPEHGSALIKLMHKYADIGMDLADASLVLLADILQSGKILTVDRRDFLVYRYGRNRAFENLMSGP